MSKKLILSILFIILLTLIAPSQSFDSPQLTVPQSNFKQSNYVPFPKILWAYWSSQKQMGQLQHHFYMQIQQFMNKGVNIEWKFILLTDANLQDFIKNYDQCMNIINSVQKITPANKADIVRLFILEQHGGLYFDITSSFVQDLSWLQLQNLLQNPFVINKHKIYSPQPDVLMFYGIFHQYRNQYYDEYNTLRNDFPGYQTWFIASKPNAIFIKDWKLKLIQYYSASADYIFNDMRQKDIFFSNFYYQTYHNVYLALYYVLQQKQKLLDTSTTIMNRNYVNLYYKVWAINCDSGPCMVYGEQIRQQSYPKYFFNKNYIQLAHQFGQQKINYFIKFTHYHLNGFRQVLTKMTQSQIKSQNLIQYYQSQVKKHKNQQPWLLNCQNFTLFLGNQSFVAKYVFSGYGNQQQQNKIKRFNQKQIQQFNQYCSQISLNQSNDEIIDKIASMNLKKYLENIVLIGFIIGISIILIVYMVCYRDYRNKRQMISINKHINEADLYIKLAYKLDYFLKQIIGIQIHYYYISIVMSAFLIYKFFIGEILNTREQFSSVFIIFLITKFTQRFSKIHGYISYVPKNMIVFIDTLQNICLCKLIGQLIFNQPNYFYFSTIFMGIFGSTVIQNIQKDKLLFNSINNLIKQFHLYSLTIVLGLFSIIQNLKYMTIKGEYLTFRLYQVYILYVWLLLIVTLLLEIQNYINKYQDKKIINPFHCTIRIIFAYWLTVSFAGFYDIYSNYIYIADLMMPRRMLLLGAICLYAATKYQYSRSVIKSRVFSIFSIILGGSITILTFLFAQIYQILIEIQENQKILTLLFEILSMVYIGLALLKILLVMCQEKCCNIPPKILKKMVIN